MEATKMLSVIRLRGTVNVNYKIEDTMKMLRLHKPNHLVLLDNRRSYLKMIHKINNYVAWGEISVEIIEKLLKERGRIIGNKPLTDEFLQKNSQYKSISEFAKKLAEMKAEISDVKGLKPVFRLHPPTKGIKGSKKISYKMGGISGYHGKDIENLINKMI